MPGGSLKIGNIDIQFGPDWDSVKANQLVQSLQQVISAVRTLSNASGAAPSTPVIAKHELADDSGLGIDHTVEGLEAGQVLVAQSATEAHFDFLKFAQLAGTDPNSFAEAVNGDVIALVNGFWSAITLASALGLSNPGTDALIMWDEAANGGAGGLSWALPGTGIKITSGRIAVDASKLSSGLSFAQASAITSVRL
jgi:hypothetical protein